MNVPFQSDHFTLQPLAEGVYAAFATEMGAGFSNAGLIDLGEQTLVFDAFDNPQAAEDLLKASIQLTHRSPSIVIISHLHGDHWGGLQVFAGSQIMATPATRQGMIPAMAEIEKDKQDPSDLEKLLGDNEALLAAETDPEKRQALQTFIARLRYTLEALPTFAPSLPNQTFEGKIVFYGTRRSVELIATGKGHTDSDCILSLPGERVAFIGDIGFFQSQPFMGHGFPLEWAALLDNMAGWDIETFVPGHGPLGNKTDLALEAAYIRALEDLVRQVVMSGGTVGDALSRTLPAPFDTWQTVGRRFEANVRAAYERQKQWYASLD